MLENERRGERRKKRKKEIREQIVRDMKENLSSGDSVSAALLYPLAISHRGRLFCN